MPRPARYNHGEPLSLLMRVALTTIARGTRIADPVEFLAIGQTVVVAPFTAIGGGIALVEVRIARNTLEALRSRGLARTIAFYEPPDAPKALFQWEATKRGLKLAELVIAYPMSKKSNVVPWIQHRWQK